MLGSILPWLERKRMFLIGKMHKKIYMQYMYITPTCACACQRVQRAHLKHQVLTSTLAQGLHLWPWRSSQKLSSRKSVTYTLLVSSPLCCLLTEITKHSPDCGICFHTWLIPLQSELCHTSRSAFLPVFALTSVSCLLFYLLFNASLDC